MQHGLNSTRPGRGAKENNTAEKMVISLKNDSYHVTGIEGGDNLQLSVEFQLPPVEGDILDNP